MSISDRIRENRDRYNAELGRLKADTDLSDEARRRKIAEAHERATTEHRRLVKQESDAAQAASKRRRGHAARAGDRRGRRDQRRDPVGVGFGG